MKAVFEAGLLAVSRVGMTGYSDEEGCGAFCAGSALSDVNNVISNGFQMRRDRYISGRSRALTLS